MPWQVRGNEELDRTIVHPDDYAVARAIISASMEKVLLELTFEFAKLYF